MANIYHEGNFQKEVLEADKPVLVDFYAEWCGPCKAFGPVLESLAVEYAGRIEMGKLNVDSDMELAMKYGVSAVPTLIIFKEGKAVERIEGAPPKTQLVQLLDSL